MHSDKIIRFAGFSALMPRGTRRFLLGILLAVLMVMLWAIKTGPMPLSLVAIGAAISHKADPLVALIVNDIRMPRLVLGLVTGASLALAGFLLQTLTRVSIASPAVMGISDGAGLLVVLALFWGDRGAEWLTSPAVMMLAALLGAVMILSILAGLFRRDPDLDKMVFSGLILAAVCKAAISLLMLVSQSDIAAQAQLWLVGSLTQANQGLNQWLCGGFGGLFILSLLSSRHIALFRVSDAVMLALGGRVKRQQQYLYLLAAGFTAIAVAGAGQIGFVGLVVPHLVSRLCPRGVLAQLLGNALGGAGLVVIADITARSVIAPDELAVGVVTALMGVPCFLLLYLKRGRH